MGRWCKKGPADNEDYELEEECIDWRFMEENCWADQNSHRVVASIKKKKKKNIEHHFLPHREHKL
jgi:hypothetical protein